MSGALLMYTYQFSVALEAPSDLVIVRMCVTSIVIAMPSVWGYGCVT